jgi:hypothetical protein
MNININRDDSNINDFLIIFEHLKNRPNRVVLNETLSGRDFEEIFKDIYKKDEINSNYLTELNPKDDGYIINRKALRQIGEKIWISFVEINKFSDDYLINDICFYYEDVNDELTINEIIDKLSNCVVDYTEDSISKVNSLTVVNNNLDLSPVIFDHEIDNDLFYNSKTLKSVEKSIKRVKKAKKGLTIFHGERGLGKTSIAKYFCSKIDRMSIFIPNNLVEQSINNPDFKNFLKKYEKCLLIIDDCEFLYTFGKNNYFTSSILQLVDGFYSDEIDVQILLIYNNSKEDIDEYLLECNNLIDIIEFDYLSPKLATELSESIGINKKFKDEAKLVDVLNSKNLKSKNTIGLK